MREGARQQIIFEEVIFHPVLTGQGVLRAGGEKAVAQPSGALARGAVHEDVRCVLPEGPACGVEDLLPPRIAGHIPRDDRLRTHRLDQTEIPYLDRTGRAAQLQIAEAERLDALERVPAGGERQRDGIEAFHRERIDRALRGQALVDEQPERAILAAGDGEGRVARMLAGQAQHLIFAGGERGRAGIGRILAHGRGAADILHVAAEIPVEPIDGIPLQRTDRRVADRQRAVASVGVRRAGIGERAEPDPRRRAHLRIRERRDAAGQERHDRLRFRGGRLRLRTGAAGAPAVHVRQETVRLRKRALEAEPRHALHTFI